MSLAAEPQSEGPPHQTHRPTCQFAEIERSVPPHGIDLRQPAVQRLVIFLNQSPRQGGTRERIPARSRNPARNDLFSNPVAKVPVARIGCILPPGDPYRRQGGDKFALLNAQQGPKVTPACGHPLHRPGRRQSAPAAAAGDAHQQGLGNVVLLVTEPKHPAARRRQLTLEKSVARRTAFALAGRTGSIRPTSGLGVHTQRSADPFAKPGVIPRGAPAQPVIKVQRQDARASIRPMRPEQEQQGQRVRPAGKRDRPGTADRPARRQSLGVEPLARNRLRQRERGRRPVWLAFRSHAQALDSAAGLRRS